MKSYVEYLLALFHGILEDVASQCSINRVDVQRDYSRLQSLVDTRGLSVFTLDLPALGKHLDRCLDQGRLVRCNLPLSRSVSRSEINPRLFQGIFRLVFDKNGFLKPDVNTQAVRGLRQLCYAGKKLRMTCHESKTFKAVSEFVDIEESLPSPTLLWSGDTLGESLGNSLQNLYPSRVCDEEPLLPLESLPVTRPLPRVDSVSQQVADIVSTQLGWYDPNEWRFKHGPGAVADQERYHDKYTFPSWPAKLEGVYPMARFAFASYDHWVTHANGEDDSMGLQPSEPPSVLIAVPKTQKTPRLIAKEPIAHQWAQQNLKSFLSEKVKDSSLAPCIDFASQDPNRRLALLASQSGSHWTIDLSSASDRLSCYVVERFFRRNIPLLEGLHAARTRWLVNPIDKKLPRYLLLRKFAAMGSATTFPVQTIVYAIVAVGCVLRQRRIPVTSRNIRSAAREVRVFGDDIIVPSDAGALVVEELSNLGFKVNADKTYRDGRFRESCGMDAFCGVDVTPAYILSLPDRSKPESMISTVEASRNFFTRGFPRASAVIERSGRKFGELNELPYVPIGSGAFGWPTAFSYDVAHLKMRFNRDLQQQEVQVRVPIGRVQLDDHKGSTGLHQFFTDDPEPTSMWKSGVGLRPRLALRRRWVGVASLSSEPLTRKSEEGRWRVAARYSPERVRAGG